MTRDSIHISMSEPLRRAQVRPRLQSLADATGLPLALVGARALTIGLGHLEGDLRLIFPAASAPAAPMVTGACDAAPTEEPPRATAAAEELPRAIAQAAAPPSAIAQAAAPPSVTASGDAPPQPTAQTEETQPTHTPSMTEPPTAAPPAVQPAPPRADPPALVTAKVAAAALGYRDAGAFHSFVFRHQELRRCSQKTGLLTLWDLDRLRAEYAAKGWKLKHARRAPARQR